MSRAELPALASVVTDQRPGGPTVVVQPLPGYPLVTVVGSYAAGARHDPRGGSGLAHLTEHLAFLAGGRAPGMERVDVEAGRAGAAVGLDRAHFRTTVLAADWRRALGVETARMAGPLRPAPARIAVERRVLVHERAARDEGASAATELESIQALVFPEGHPYHRPVLGRPEELATLRGEDVEAFHRARYSPATAVVAVVGGVDLDAVLGEVARLAPRGSPALAADPVPSSPLPAGETARALLRPSARARVWLAFALPGDRSPALPLLEVVGRALAIGSASALASELVVERQVAEAVTGYLTWLRDASLFGIRAMAAAGVEAAELVEALLTALRRVVERGLSREALARGRAKASTDLLSLLQRPSRRAELFAEASAGSVHGTAGLAARAECYAGVELDEARETLARLWCGRRALLSIDPAPIEAGR